MSNKNKNRNGIVYSTDPDFNPFENLREMLDNPKPAAQNLLVRISTSGRAGKKATLVQRFAGSQDDLEQLARKLKVHCGTGGSVKDGEIVLQGDCIQKTLDFLISCGYKARKG